MTVILIITSATAATPYFKDIDEHWAEEYIETLRRLDVMRGNNNIAYTENFITRGEFTALIIRTLYDVDYTKNNSIFTDVNKSHIFAPYIYLAYENSLITGVTDTLFMPDNNITREEIAIIISRIDLIHRSGKTINFKDITSDYKYKQEISVCLENNIISGYENNTFRPYAKTTRAEAAAMIVRMLSNVKNNVKSKDVIAFSKQYFEQEFADKNYCIEHSIGQARNDLLFIKSISEEMQTSINNYDNINIELVYSEGNLHKTRINAETNINGNKYKMIKNYYIISVGETLKLYDINTDLQLNKKINLTWEVGNTPPSYSPVGLTHLSPSFFEISVQNKAGKSVDIGLGKIKLYDLVDDKLLSYAKQNKYEIWAMFKTDFTTDTANEFLNNQSARMSAIKYIAFQCLENGITGINLDFENMNLKDKYVYSQFIHEIELVFHHIGAIVSVDITKYEKTSEYWSLCYDRNRISEYSDYVMLMAYDQYYSGSKTPGPVGGLNWVENSIILTLREIPSEKLVLGMPYYTRYWQCKNGKVVSSKAISMETAIKLIKENNAELVYVENDKQHKAVWYQNDTEHSFWFETAETIGKRVDLAKKYNLPGVASWRRGFETADVWDIINLKLYN